MMRRFSNCFVNSHSLGANHLLFWAEICAIVPAVCHGFIPVLTPGYLERIGLADGQGRQFKHVAVFEEFTHSMALVNAQKIDCFPILRGWGSKSVAEFSLPGSLVHSGFYSLASEAYEAYAGCVADIAYRLNYSRQNLMSPVNMMPDNWIALYIDWCRITHPECAGCPVETWEWLTSRPTQFLKHVNSVLQREKATELERIRNRESQTKK